MAKRVPGKSHRKGITVVDLLQMFPDDSAAEAWFEAQRWPNGERFCPDCGSVNYAIISSKKPMPYRCRDCREYFSVRKGTVMQSGKLGFQKWIVALYMMTTGIKGTSSMKLHRDLGIRQATAWHLMQRIREGFNAGATLPMPGPVEVDETYIGGKVAVVGATGQQTLQGFVFSNAEPGATIYTDDHGAYQGLPNHASVKHSTGEYKRGSAHTNGVESFWSLLKRGYHGTYHKMSAKHLDRYVNEFVGRHNVRELDTMQ